MFSEDDLLPISALQHLLYCPRQCALIHIEQVWAENRFTIEGRHLHDKAHAAGAELRRGVRLVRSLPLRSLDLGLFGVADIVEFHPPAGRGDVPAAPPNSRIFHDIPTLGDPPDIARNAPITAGVPTPALVPFPVEYKRGRPKSHDADCVHLCAQAMCLEEMLGCSVPAGALFYGKTRRRQDVTFDAPLRELTRRTAQRLHEMVATRTTPPAVRDEKCPRCSLLHLCLPDALSSTHRASRYMKNALDQALRGPPMTD